MMNCRGKVEFARQGGSVTIWLQSRLKEADAARVGAMVVFRFGGWE